MKPSARPFCIVTLLALLSTFSVQLSTVDAQGTTFTFQGRLNDGGRYNPSINGWTAINTNGAPAARNTHTAVWTGSEMIIWGGYGGSSYQNDGGRYNPVGNSWTPVSANSAPAARAYHTAIWTGSEMVLWGGYNGSVIFNDTWSYTPGRVLYLYQRL